MSESSEFGDYGLPEELREYAVREPLARWPHRDDMIEEFEPRMFSVVWPQVSFDDALVCSRCNFTATGRGFAVELYADGVEFACPICDQAIVFEQFPEAPDHGLDAGMSWAESLGINRAASTDGL